MNHISNEWRVLDPLEIINTPAEKARNSAAVIDNKDEKKRSSQKTTAKTTPEMNTLN